MAVHCPVTQPSCWCSAHMMQRISVTAAVGNRSLTLYSRCYRTSLTCNPLFEKPLALATPSLTGSNSLVALCGTYSRVAKMLSHCQLGCSRMQLASPTWATLSRRHTPPLLSHMGPSTASCSCCIKDTERHWPLTQVIYVGHGLMTARASHAHARLILNPNQTPNPC